jgi:CHASE2 domain-containing sensor protein
MYPYQRSKARAYAIPAVLVSILAGYTGAVGLPLFPTLFWLIAVALSMKACYHLGIAKGWDPAVAFLGILTVPGMMVTALLRDRHPEEAAAVFEALESAAASNEGDSDTDNGSPAAEA